TEAEGDVEFEIADDVPTLFEPAQDLVRRAPTGGPHEAGYRTFEAALAGDLSLLLIGVVTLHGLEVLAQEFVVVKVALDEFALVLARFPLGFGQVGAAHAELRQHDLGRLGAVIFAVQFAAALDRRQPHFPRTVGEHDDMGAELGGGIDRVLAGRHGVDAAVEGILRPRPNLDARLLVEFAVAFDEPGLQRLDDHRSRLVEALPRLVHAQTKRRELPARKAAPETQPQPAFA